MQIFGILVLVVIMFCLSIITIQKFHSELGRNFWNSAALSGVVSLFLLAALSWVHLFVYACVVFIILMAVREASKHMFKTPKGGYVLGIYYGLWMSIPIGAYQYGTH